MTHSPTAHPRRGGDPAKAPWLKLSTAIPAAICFVAPAFATEPPFHLQTEDLINAAYEAAGGETWRRPETLIMRGTAVFYDGETAKPSEEHVMWRVYDGDKSDAHTADGKVRVRSVRDGIAFIDVAFDGQTTSTVKGPQPQSEADKRWASNFGFGVIRHALDDGYRVERLAPDFVDGHASEVVRVIDPEGGETLFWIDSVTYAIRKVGFDTERGWHERIYSDFFSKPGTDWQQPGLVRLYYNGVRANDVRWTDFDLNTDIPDCVFTLPEVEGCKE